MKARGQKGSCRKQEKREEKNCFVSNLFGGGLIFDMKLCLCTIFVSCFAVPFLLFLLCKAIKHKTKQMAKKKKKDHQNTFGKIGQGDITSCIPLSLRPVVQLSNPGKPKIRG